MEITIETVEKLAALARLRFNEDEKQSMTHDLKNMISFVEKLQELDTTGIEPVLHMGDAVNALRKDEVKGSISRDEALSNSPVKDQQFFKVPKVIKK
ncbi:Asp-tRNA(Asn)/Glu-tRNA(Gln) amidotransferase subunit GatC [Chitinophagaceae bacterium LWZ2-11]